MTGQRERVAQVLGTRGAPQPGDRAAADQRLAALRWARAQYPGNGWLCGGGDAPVDAFVRTATQVPEYEEGDALPVLLDECGYLLVPGLGVACAVERRTDDGIALFGSDVGRRRVFRSGPYANLDSAILAAVAHGWPPGRCDRCAGPRMSPAALLPVPHPPQIVVLALCDQCYGVLDANWTDLQFLYPTPATPEGIA